MPAERWRWAAVVAWMAGIYLLSAQSRLPDLTPGAPGLQEIAGHFLAYGGLAWLWASALCSSGMRPATAIIAAVAASVLYGVTDELHQSMVPGRNPSFADLAVDTVGAAVAMAVFWRRQGRAV